jgi:hypothetical protein
VRVSSAYLMEYRSTKLRVFELMRQLGSRKFADTRIRSFEEVVYDGYLLLTVI